jgi:hypothetical protein
VKYLAALPLAAVFAIGMASGAQAWGVVPSEYKAQLMDTYYGDSAYESYDRCLDSSAGSASDGCATGGPSGSLF